MAAPSETHDKARLRAALVLAALAVAAIIPATITSADMSAVLDTNTAPGNQTFYVARWGNDRNAGTDPHRPWRTVGRVNRAQLKPGDQVLFRGSETFTDDTLMPGEGVDASGTAKYPITFRSWGEGLATLTRGIWLGTNRRHPNGPSNLTFRKLALGPRSGFQGTGDHITLVGLQITNIVHRNHRDETGIETEGSHWVIADNRIDGTGDSGMLLGFDSNAPGEPAGGTDYRVYDNVIERTGLDPTMTQGTHGIYLKVRDAVVESNQILGFRDNGVSVRYRDAQVVGNTIAHGSIGIAWFQYDTAPGTSRFLDNAIDDTTSAGIFVCGTMLHCAQPLESFVIRGNRITDARGVQLNLMPSSGRYTVSNNG